MRKTIICGAVGALALLGSAVLADNGGINGDRNSGTSNGSHNDSSFAITPSTQKATLGTPTYGMPNQYQADPVSSPGGSITGSGAYSSDQHYSGKDAAINSPGCC